jgi:hypothetical protein
MLARELLKRDFELVQAVVSRFVDARRLAGRPDEHAGKQIRQRRMILPVRQQALQQVRAPQQRAVRRGRASQRDVIAATGAHVAAVEHELFSRQARLPRFLVKRFGGRDQFLP